MNVRLPFNVRRSEFMASMSVVAVLVSAGLAKIGHAELLPGVLAALVLVQGFAMFSQRDSAAAPVQPTAGCGAASI